MKNLAYNQSRFTKNTLNSSQINADIDQPVIL